MKMSQNAVRIETNTATMSNRSQAKSHLKSVPTSDAAKRFSTELSRREAVQHAMDRTG